MNICGFQKTTLLDYPGHLAAVIFTGGCNFRCPFCHNRELLEVGVQGEVEAEEILEILQKRKRILDGVCITGGEPLLQDDIADFIRRIHTLGLKVKLDTNGSRPDILKQLCLDGLVHYVAMDIKNEPKHYRETAGCSENILPLVMESVDFLKQWDKDYEFRTTIVRELHNEKNIRVIGEWIAGAKQYYLQSYVHSENVLIPGFSSYNKADLDAFVEIVKPLVSHVELRGTD